MQFCAIVAARSLSFLRTDVAFPVCVSTRRRLITIYLRKHVRAIILTNAIFSSNGVVAVSCLRYRSVTLVPEDCLRDETKTRRYRVVPRENRREAEVYVYMKRPACLFLAYTQVRKYIVTPP